MSLDRSGCSSSNSGDDRREICSRAVSPWNCSGSFSEHSEGEDTAADLTVSNLPPYELGKLQVSAIPSFHLTMTTLDSQETQHYNIDFNWDSMRMRNRRRYRIVLGTNSSVFVKSIFWSSVCYYKRYC